MPSLSDVYGSGKFIKADSDGCIDIDGKPYEKVVTIEKTHVHEFPPEKGEEEGKKQIVTTFRELPEMELGLNITNSRSIAKLANTEDWEKWPGTVLELCVVPEEKSKTGHAIRIRKPRAGASAQNGHAPQIASSATFGPIAGARLKQRLEKEKRAIINLRGFLTAKYPNYSAQLAGDPEVWPSDTGLAVAEWFAKPEAVTAPAMDDDSIPF